MKVCWAPSEEEAKRTAHAWWATDALKGPLSTELALPEHFEQAAGMVTPDDVANTVVCGPDPARYADEVRKFLTAGIDHIYFHQVGRDQKGFFGFWEAELRPALDVLGGERGPAISEQALQGR
jgi:hypothetical protein